MKKIFAVTAAIALLSMGLAAQAITIETVPVGDAGNAADTRIMADGTTGFGSVGYNYNIGKYEVTSGQYTAFLNAVAATDTHELYNTEMSNSFWGNGITRSGDSGGYTYGVASDYANRPVSFVSFWDCCRFANWLGNGQGNGDTETGAYTLTADGIANNTITRNAKATWAVTSEDEWYKAAYYKGGSMSAGYWIYPASSDTTPGRDMADASGNNSNYYVNGYLIGPPYWRTEVGEFQNSDSPCGTFDQGGNVFEWNEAIISGAYRGLRGGSFDYSFSNQQAMDHERYDASAWYGNIGFRVSAVPEPSSLMVLLSGVGGLGGLMWRKRR